MRIPLKLVIILVLFLGVHGCTRNGTPIVHPSDVRFVPQSQPDSVLETGIGQDPQSGGMFLQWYRTSGASIYKLYRTDSTSTNGAPVSFSSVATLMHSPSVNDTSYVDPTAQIGTRYYYYLLASTSDGSLTKLSDTINFRLLERPILNFPGVNATLDSVSYFKWIDNTGGGYTVIRVSDISTAPQTYLWISSRLQIYNTNPTEPFNFDNRAVSGFVSGHTYRWRVDRFNLNGAGVPFEGARSMWQTFSIK